jgi:hypothetical protein
MQCQFGVIPVLYYVFDYLTRVYTDLLSSGAPVVVEFMPFICCGAYLVFLLYNFTKGQEENRMREIQKSLDMQVAQSMRYGSRRIWPAVTAMTCVIIYNIYMPVWRTIRYRRQRIIYLISVMSWNSRR